MYQKGTFPAYIDLHLRDPWLTLPSKLVTVRQACSPLIQLFFGFASEWDIDQTNTNRDIRDGNWLSSYSWGCPPPSCWQTWGSSPTSLSSSTTPPFATGLCRRAQPDLWGVCHRCRCFRFRFLFSAYLLYLHSFMLDQSKPILSAPICENCSPLWIMTNYL